MNMFRIDLPADVGADGCVITHFTRDGYSYRVEMSRSVLSNKQLTRLTDSQRESFEELDQMNCGSEYQQREYKFCMADPNYKVLT